VILHRPVVTNEGSTILRLGHLVHRQLPGVLRDLGISCGQIGAGNLEVKNRLPEGFDFCVKKGGGLRLIAGAETLLFSRYCVFGIRDIPAPEQD
jgi:hypothetical protein